MRITAVQWVRKPSKRELDPHVAPALRKQRISAQVYLGCRVLLDTHVRDCVVLRETPEDSGFGAAALAAAPSFRIYPPRLNGKPVDGAGVIVPVEYSYR